MEKKEQPQQICYNCESFKGYYTKGNMQFEKTKYGKCLKYRKIIEEKDHCKFWELKDFKNEICKKTSLKFLSEMLNNISGIKQILEETNEDAKIND